ncbi:MAG TPA: FAD-binding protein [Trebonia sp.]|jgi:FAD/FMN-containing dehydrogenase|nr:FAD-binding protein [Trebonia sp.]
MSIGDDLRRALTGPVLVPGEDGFEQGRRPWNLAIDQQVRAVVVAVDAHDVSALVRYARRNGLTITAQPSGHGASGDTADAILLRTGQLDEFQVRPGHRTARVGAGVKWARVQKTASRYGLTGLAGSSPAVTVTSYLLGGGLSWFSRMYGQASGSVRAFDVVDADGSRTCVDADTDPDLFWALRGGGGDYALVTAVDFDLQPVDALYGGRMLWPAEQAARVLDAFREVTATAPDQLTTWYTLIHPAASPPLVAVDVTYLGQAADGEAALSRLDQIAGRLYDSRGKMAVADLGDITAEATDPGPFTSRTELLTALDDEAAARLLDRPIDPLRKVQIRHLGGAFARPSDSAAGHIGEPYSMYMFGIPGEGVRDRFESLAHTLASHTTGRKPFTHLAPGEHAASAFPEATLGRLRAVKRRRDPYGVFRSNFPVLAGEIQVAARR